MTVMEIFEEIVSEAKTGKIILKDYDIYNEEYTYPVRLPFSFQEKGDGYCLETKDYDCFQKKLKEYAYESLNFYQLEINPNTIKKVLTHIWSNITEPEMDCVEDYLERRIQFFKEESFYRDTISLPCDLGKINGCIQKQSVYQETPYYFQAFLNQEERTYYLPRISFGIANNICYIYSIQNKEIAKNQDSEYNELVSRKMRTINSGIKEYRNVTPSFIVTLVFFLSFLKQHQITEVHAMPTYPLREEKHKLVNQYKIERNTMSGKLDAESIRVLKEELELKRLMDSYNANIKFHNCFQRLKSHFSGLFLQSNRLTDELILLVDSLKTDYPFLQQIVAESQDYMVK